MPTPTCPACGATLPSDLRCDDCDVQNAQPTSKPACAA